MRSNEHRASVILIGGTASIAHGIVTRKTDDVDILASLSALSNIEDAISQERNCFLRNVGESIAWEKRDETGDDSRAYKESV
ncbi:hypothetical protein BDY21DRAFT_374624 [Lineolata rhizophorae]|uniref:Uncharacterized protein n=1 Tax=Lineolata rhizophorae TaxID=578093 RepID=A0A6A6NRA2_9PEZI|nr:hypothetical protein BDY21DRAFT_374624 [Lineolata rhizophorae]